MLGAKGKSDILIGAQGSNAALTNYFHLTKITFSTKISRTFDQNRREVLKTANFTIDILENVCFTRLSQVEYQPS